MYGYLRLLRPNKVCPQYELEEGNHTIGASNSCNIHLKQVNQKDLLLDIHAIVKVHSDGVATIHNQSNGAPVTLNDKRMTSKPQILLHGAKFKVLDKEFQYMNDRFKDLMEDDNIFITAKNNILKQNTTRKSVNPLGSTKKTPIFKTKTKSPPKTPLNRSLMSRLPTSRPPLQRTINTSTTKTPITQMSAKRPTITPRLTLPAKPFTSTGSLKKQGTPYRLSIKSQRLSIKKETPKVIKPIDNRNESESDLATELDESLDAADANHVANVSRQKGTRISGEQTQNINLRLSRSFKQENIQISMSEIQENDDTSEEEKVQHFDARNSRRISKPALNRQEGDTSKRYSRKSTASYAAKQEQTGGEQNVTESSSESSPEYENDQGPNKSRANVRQSQIGNKSVNYLEMSARRLSRKSHEVGNTSKKQQDISEHFDESNSENSLDLEEANTSAGNLTHSQSTLNKSLNKSQSYIPRASSRYSKNYQPVVGSSTKDQSQLETSEDEEIQHSKPSRYSRASHRPSLIQPEPDNEATANVSSRSQRNTSVRRSKVTREQDQQEVSNQDRATSPRKSLKASRQEENHEASEDEHIKNISSRSHRTISPRKSLKATMEDNHHEPSDDEEFANNQVNISSRSQRTTSPRKSLKITREQDYPQASEEDMVNNQANTSSRRSLKAPQKEDSHDFEDEEIANYQANTSSRSRRTTSPRKSLKVTSEDYINEASEDEEIENSQTNISSRSHRTISPRKSLKATMEENYHVASDDEEIENNQANISSRSQRNTLSRRSLKAPREEDNHDLLADEEIANNLTNTSSRSQRTTSPRKSLKVTREEANESSENEDIDNNKTNISSRSHRTISPRKSLKVEENHHEASEDEDIVNNHANISSTSQRNTSSRRSLKVPREEDNYNFLADKEITNNLTNTSSRSRRTTSPGKSFKVTREDDEFSENEDIENNQTNISSRSHRTISPRKSLKVKENHKELEDDEIVNNQANISSRSQRNTSSRRSLKVPREEDNYDFLADEEIANNLTNTSSRSRRTTSPRKSLKVTREEDIHDVSEDEDNENNQTNISSRSHRSISPRKSLKVTMEENHHESSEDEDIVNNQTNISSRSLGTISPRKSLKDTMTENQHDVTDDDEFAMNQSNISSRSQRTSSPRKSLKISRAQELANISSRSQRNTSSRRSLKAPQEEDNHYSLADEEIANNLTNTSSRSQRNTSPRKSLKVTRQEDIHEASEDEDIKNNQTNVSSRTISPRKSLKATIRENHHESSDDEEFAINQANISSRSQRTTSPRKSLKTHETANISSRSQRNTSLRRSLKAPQEEGNYDSSEDEEMANNQTNISSRTERNTSARKSIKVTSKQDIQDNSEDEVVNLTGKNKSTRTSSPRKSLKVTRESEYHNSVSDDEDMDSHQVSSGSQKISSPRKSLKVINKEDMHETSENEVENQNPPNVSARTSSPRKSLKVTRDEFSEDEVVNQNEANISSRSQGNISARRSMKVVETAQSTPEEDEMLHVVPRKSRSSIKPHQENINASRNSYRRSNVGVSFRASVDMPLVNVSTLEKSSSNMSRSSLRPSTQNDADISSRKSSYSRRSTLPAGALDVSTSRNSKLGLRQSQQALDSGTDDTEMVANVSSVSNKAASLRRSLKAVSTIDEDLEMSQESHKNTTSRKSRPSYRQSQGGFTSSRNIDVSLKEASYSRRSTLPAKYLDLTETSLRKSKKLSPYVEGDNDVFMSGDEINSTTRKSARKTDAYLSESENDSRSKSRREASYSPSKPSKVESNRSTIGRSFSESANLKSNFDELSTTNPVNDQSNLTKEDELLVNRSGRKSYTRRQFYSSNIGGSSKDGRRSRNVTARKPAAKIDTSSSMAQNYDEDSDEPSPDFSLVLSAGESEDEDTIEHTSGRNDASQSIMTYKKESLSISSRNTSTVPNSRETSAVGSRNVSRDIKVPKRKSTFDDSTQDANPEAFRLTSTGSTPQDASKRATSKRQSTFDDSTQDANTQAFRLTSTGSTPQDASKRATSRRQSTFDASTQDANPEAFRLTSTGSTPQDVSKRAISKRQSTFDESTQEFRLTSTGSTPQDASRRATSKRQSTFDASTQDANPEAFRLTSTRSTPQDVSKRATSKRQSTFDESTQQMINASTSQKAITIDDDDTVEVLSPVQPIASGRKSGRKSQNDTSTSRRSTSKLGDSSLTNTQMSQSTGSVVTVSSQSFSSFKKGDSQLDSRKQVLDKSSASDTRIKSPLNYTPNRQDSRSRRLTSEIFEAVSFTSTPFAKSVGLKKSLGATKKSLLKVTKQTSIIQSEVIVSSMEVTSDFSRVRSQSIIEISDSTARRSRRASATRKGHHNCISCGETSMRRSKSLSDAKDLSLTVNHKTDDLSKSVDVSSVKNKSLKESRDTTKNTPLLHRKSLVSSVLSVNTPEKQGESEDETPKSHVKPSRRSSKANQSTTYNPVLEDITPVTPERLQVSGFTETFKTPVNTPGLFENIRKSAIRSRKRLRESTGSALKVTKKAKMDVEQDADNFMSVEKASPVKRQQKSPLNRLSNFEGVKKLMKTPPKSPKNDLRNIPNLRRIMAPQNSPRNDLTEPVGVKRLFKHQKQPKNDLSDISGVQNIFNVSGTEVLHQGSDIENSEDLFTKLTGKRPMRAYTSRGSVSPVKSNDTTQAHRKTMGDLPLCSPRVQQWVEEHSNFVDEPSVIEQNLSKNMSSAPTKSARKSQRMTQGNNLEESGSQDSLLENVSEEPNKRARTGRSLSPQKGTNQQNRRHTQGDALIHKPKSQKAVYTEEIADDLIENMPDNMEVKKRVGRSLSAKKPPRDSQRRVTQAYNLKLSNEANDSLNDSQDLSINNVSNKSARGSRSISPQKSARKSSDRGSLRRTSSVKREHEDYTPEKHDVKPEQNSSAKKSRDSQQRLTESYNLGEEHASKKPKLSVSQSKNKTLEDSMDLFDESFNEDPARNPDQTLLDNLPTQATKTKSRSGRSISPNKRSSTGVLNRRKTQGDLLSSSPKVTDWKSRRQMVVSSSLVPDDESNSSKSEDVQIATISSSVNIDLDETVEKEVDTLVVKKGKAATKKSAPKKETKRKEVESADEAPATRRGRTAEKNIEVAVEHKDKRKREEEEPVTIPEVVTRERRGRGVQKKEITPSVKVAKPKKGKVTEQEEVIEITPVTAVTSKTKREQETPNILSDVEEAATKPKRGKAKQTAIEVVEEAAAHTPTKPTRGKPKRAAKEVVAHSSIESITVEPSAKPKKGKVAQPEEVIEVTPITAVTSKPKRNRETPIIQSDVEETATKPKRGKAKQTAIEVVEDAAHTPTKPARGKPKEAANEVVAHSSSEALVKPKKGKVAQPEEVIEITPITAVTSKTKREQETPIIQSDVEETTTKPKRGKAKQAAIEVVEESTHTPTKSRRARPKQATKEVVVPTIEPVPVETSVKPRRGRAVQEATPDAENATRPKRGKAQAQKKESVQETPEKAAPKTVKAKADTRTVIVASDVEVTPDVSSSTKANKGKGAEKESEKAVVEDTVENEAKPKPKRGKAAQQSVKEIADTPDEVVSSRPTRRGQKNVKPTNEPSEIEIKVAKKGGKQAQAVVEPTEKPEEKELPARARRGRAAREKEIAPVPLEEQEVVNKPLETVKKGARRKRVPSQADTIESDANSPIRSRPAKRVRFESTSNVEDPKMEIETSKPARGGRKKNIDIVVVDEPIEVKKPARGRSKNNKPDVEPEVIVETDEEGSSKTRKNVTEPAIAKPTRGRGKVNAKVESTVDEAEKETEEASKAKVTRGKGKKNVKAVEAEEFVDEEVQFNRPVRTRGKKIVPETIVEDVEMPAKSSRDKAKKNVKVEEVVESADEKVVESKTKTTRSRAPKAAPVEPEEVQSRPTRARSRRN